LSTDIQPHLQITWFLEPLEIPVIVLVEFVSCEKERFKVCTIYGADYLPPYLHILI